MKIVFKLVGLSILLSVSGSLNAQDLHELYQSELERRLDSIFHCSSLVYLYGNDYLKLSDKDIAEAADSLGVDKAAIRAVIEIEAGTTHRGLLEEGVPVVNFSLNKFQKLASKRGVDMMKAEKSHPEVFARPNVSKYGSYGNAQFQRLKGALAIDSVAAVESAFWGMFQIGGFNWKRCGCNSISEFVDRICDSEREQLALFIRFIENIGLKDSIRKKDWNSFARVYNGPAYRKRGYHRKLAAAYNKFKEK